LPEPRTRLVLGLGNPGSEYVGTRHNVGAMVVDLLARRHRVRLWRRRFQATCGKGSISARAAWLIKPRVYMNRSGWSVAAARQELKLDLGHILVIADDIALPTAKIRMREKGSSGGHKGLQSVIDELGTEDFARLRIGVGAPEDGDAAAYVLAPFEPGELDVIEDAVARAAAAVACWLGEGAARAMTAFND